MTMMERSAVCCSGSSRFEVNLGRLAHERCRIEQAEAFVICQWYPVVA